MTGRGETGSLSANLNVNRSELEINIGEKRKNEGEDTVVETQTQESVTGQKAVCKTATLEDIQCKKTNRLTASSCTAVKVSNDLINNA